MAPLVRTRRGCLWRQDARGDQGDRLSKLRISIAHDDDSVRFGLGAPLPPVWGSAWPFCLVGTRCRRSRRSAPQRNLTDLGSAGRSLAPAQELAPHLFAVRTKRGQGTIAGLGLAHPPRWWRWQGDGAAGGVDSKAPQVRVAQDGLHIIDACEGDLRLFE